jgi:hypothetical protein
VTTHGFGTDLWKVRGIPLDDEKTASPFPGPKLGCFICKMGIIISGIPRMLQGLKMMHLERLIQWLAQTSTKQPRILINYQIAFLIFFVWVVILNDLNQSKYEKRNMLLISAGIHSGLFSR